MTMNTDNETMKAYRQDRDRKCKTLNVECVGCTGGDADESGEYMVLHRGEYGWTLRCYNCMAEVKVHG